MQRLKIHGCVDMVYRYTTARNRPKMIMCDDVRAGSSKIETGFITA